MRLTFNKRIRTMPNKTAHIPQNTTLLRTAAHDADDAAMKNANARDMATHGGRRKRAIPPHDKKVAYGQIPAAGHTRSGKSGVTQTSYQQIQATPAKCAAAQAKGAVWAVIRFIVDGNRTRTSTRQI